MITVQRYIHTQLTQYFKSSLTLNNFGRPIEDYLFLWKISGIFLWCVYGSSFWIIQVTPSSPRTLWRRNLYRIRGENSELYLYAFNMSVNCYVEFHYAYDISISSSVLHCRSLLHLTVEQRFAFLHTDEVLNCRDIFLFGQFAIKSLRLNHYPVEIPASKDNKRDKRLHLSKDPVFIGFVKCIINHQTDELIDCAQT